ncbi:MAG: ABC transporter substrate-binding protein, partial [Anaerolineales bacterium]
ISTLALGLLAGPLPTEAQQTGKVYRIGYLAWPSSAKPAYDAFRREIFRLGYADGQTIAFESRFAKGKRKRLKALAAELVSLNVDVIVTSFGPEIGAAQRATRTIPIVMAGGAGVDPVKRGWVASLARPGGNMTGVMNMSGELHPKRLELLKEVSPRISRVAILWPPRVQKQRMNEVEATRQALGIQVQTFPGGGGKNYLESTLSAIDKDVPHALLVVTSIAALDNRSQIIDFANKRQLLTIFDRDVFVTAGGFMSYGVDFRDLHRRTASYVDKILKGAKPGDLPIEQPRKFEFVINLKTAKALGLTIPPSVLLQATKVIK